MSSILKALKKLEQDKNPQKAQSLSIEAAIIKNKPGRQLTSTNIATAALFLFICGGTAMYFVMKPTSVTVSDERTKTPEPAVLQAPPPVVVIPPPVQPETIKPSRESKPPVKLPAEIPPHKIDIMPRKSAQTEEKPVANSLEPQAESPKTVQQKPVKPIPVLKVNGIAFQEGGADSIAVVNGISVSKGSVVDGVTVDEILKDRVRFKLGTETLEVDLGKSSR